MTIAEAHADALAQLPQCCRDCGATGPLHLAYASGIGDVLYCPHCAEHPDHKHTADCPQPGTSS